MCVCDTKCVCAPSNPRFRAPWSLRAALSINSPSINRLTTSKMKYTKDKSGNERPEAWIIDKRAKHIEKYGLPVTVHYEERSGGKYACLRMDPAPGFVELASPACVQGCLKDHGQYHSTVCWKPKLTRYGTANAKDAFQRIKSKFANPVRTRLKVAFVSRETCVVSVHQDEPLFKDVLGAMRFIRMHYGNHTSKYITVSL